MAFIRHKQVNGTTYYQLVESFRDHGRVRQRVIVSLGESPSLDEPIAVEERRVDLYQRLVDKGAEDPPGVRSNGRYSPGRRGWWLHQLGDHFCFLPVGETAKPYLAKA